MPLIRRVMASDYQSWKVIWDGYLKFYKTELGDDITSNTWKDLLDPSTSITGFVAELDAQICAIAHCFLRPSTWHKVGYLYLEDLYVDPKSRGQAIGRELLDQVVAYGRQIGAERLYWITKEDNEIARRLYDSYIPSGASGFIHYEYLL